jgi:hypothetical protein
MSLLDTSVTDAFLLGLLDSGTPVWIGLAPFHPMLPVAEIAWTRRPGILLFILSYSRSFTSWRRRRRGSLDALEWRFLFVVRMLIHRSGLERLTLAFFIEC